MSEVKLLKPSMGMTNFEFTKMMYTIIRSNRKSISIEIKPSGITVRAPLRMSNAEVERFLESKNDWIEKHVEKVAERNRRAEELPPLTAEQLRKLVQKAKEHIPSRVAYYAAIIGVDYGRITIRSQHTRWGSCSAQGNLNFNCLLMLLPNDVIDSVVVHELCHRKHMNHSPKFYEEVEKVFPEYQRCRRWLKENGSIHLSRLP